MRHAVTTPGVGDPPGFRLDDCSTQRNLTDEGRRDARRVGEDFRERAIGVEDVLSSPWCRCIETAKLAFGKAEASTALSNLFTHPENRDRQVREMRDLIRRAADRQPLACFAWRDGAGADRRFARNCRNAGRHAAGQKASWSAAV